LYPQRYCDKTTYIFAIVTVSLMWIFLLFACGWFSVMCICFGGVGAIGNILNKNNSYSSTASNNYNTNPIGMRRDIPINTRQYIPNDNIRRDIPSDTSRDIITDINIRRDSSSDNRQDITNINIRKESSSNTRRDIISNKKTRREITNDDIKREIENRTIIT
jgi:hypothetical protein